MIRRLALSFAVVSVTAALASVTPPASALTTANAVMQRAEKGLVDVNVDLPYQGYTGAGTGMVLGSGGEILTNNHVILGATTIRVVDIANHRTYSAAVVGYDIGADVAVLHLHGARGLRRVPLGNSSTVHVGDDVTAMGNAGGAGGAPSTASGKITSRNRSITAIDDLGGSEQLNGLLETDASLQPGDSGGPLLSSSGKVIGMDTAGSSSFSLSSTPSAGFAVPINEALRIARAIEARRPSAAIHLGPTAFLGVEVAPRTSYNSGARLSTLVVTGVIPGTPAAQAGLSPGDTLTSFNNGPVSSPSSLTSLLLSQSPGATVSLSWLDAAGTPQSGTVTLASGPAQ